MVQEKRPYDRILLFGNNGQHDSATTKYTAQKKQEYVIWQNLNSAKKRSKHILVEYIVQKHDTNRKLLYVI